MNGSLNNYPEIINGEIEIISEEINKFNSLDCTASLGVSDFLESIKSPLISVEQKIGTNSIEYIKLSTTIVELVSNRILIYTDFGSIDKSIENLSALETVKHFARQKESLVEALNACRKIESYNMDYAYRTRTFNATKKEIERRCKEKDIDIRTTSQKTIDRLKTAGEITGGIAVETTGCVLSTAFKIAIIIGIFLLIMTILGVEY